MGIAKQSEGRVGQAQGLFGAPPITVIVGDEVHVSLLKALTMLGLGRECVVRVPVDSQGRMRADALPRISGPTIVCIQAGNVNTGAFDPAAEIIQIAHEAGDDRRRCGAIAGRYVAQRGATTVKH